MNKKTKKIIFMLISSLLFTASPVLAAGTFNLSYMLTEGGYQLELNSANLYRGVNLRIDTDIGKRYQVIQRIIQPLISKDNPGVSIQDNFMVRAIRGTNRFGDLRFSTGDTPVRSEDIVYISNISGQSDSFSLVYGLVNPDGIRPGLYYGRISFTLVPIGSNQQQVTKILEVYVSITSQGPIKPMVEISTKDSSKRMLLNPKKEKNQASDDVIVKINSTPKKQFSIIQFMFEPLESEDGKLLENNAVNFTTRNTIKGTAINSITPLSGNPQKVYTSGIDGSTDNFFIITYALGDLSNEKAGKYKSRIQYLWEEAGVQTKIDNLELVIDNERIFDLIVTPQDQKYEIEFRGLKPMGQPKTSEVTLEIKSNTGKPYQISQEISSGLVNKEGQEIPGKYFMLHTEKIDATGSLKFTDKQEVNKGNTVLYVSDNLGKPAKFKVIYELSSPMDVKAGDYSANVAYTILEM